jgi:hypothetical protein
MSFDEDDFDSNDFQTDAEVERFDILVYRNDVLIFDDATDEVISFQIELSLTSERSEARIRFDGEKSTPTLIKENDAIEIWISSGGASIKRIFSGEIEEVNKVREEGELYIDVVAYDWSKLLSERKVNLSYPTITLVSDIVKDVVDDIRISDSPSPNERKITVLKVENVYKTRTLDLIGLSMYEALKKLSSYSLCDFFVDDGKDLNWFIRGSKSTGKILTENDLQNYEYVRGKDVTNQCKVYGAANRMEPKYNPDALSDSIEGWEMDVPGEAATITLTGSPNTFSAASYPGWIRNRANAPISEILTTNSWDNDYAGWEKRNVFPYLEADDENYIRAKATQIGEETGACSFLTPSTFILNDIEEWSTINLNLHCRWDNLSPTVWQSLGTSLADFSGYAGSVECTTALWIDAIYGRAWHTLSNAAAYISTIFNIYIPDPTGYPEGARIDLLYLTESDENATIRVQIYVEIMGGVFRWKMKGTDSDGNPWSQTSNVSPTGGWLPDVYCLTVKWAGSGNAYIVFRNVTDNLDIMTRDGVNLANRLKCILFTGSWTGAYGSDSSVRYTNLTIQTSKQYSTISSYLWIESESRWQDLSTFDILDYWRSWTTVTIDLLPYITIADDLINAKVFFKLESQTGEEDADGYACIGYAAIQYSASYFYGEGSPYINDDDNDEDYVEASSLDAEDSSWSDFGITIVGMASHVETKIYVKARNVEGTNAVGLIMYIKDPVSSAWISLGEQTWGTSETSFITKAFDATAYLKTPELVMTELKFKKTGNPASTIRVTYAYLSVTFIQSSALIIEDFDVKKAGDCSIKMYRAGTGIGTGTIEATIWRELPDPIICQTIDHKEGETILAFAALIDMYTRSDLDYWERPEALLDEFQVRLYDGDGNAVIYSASDLYPESSFTAIPGPIATKMKEIKIPVGENAEADGSWEREDSAFDWADITTIEFTLRGKTDITLEGNPYLESITLYLDWLHFEEGRWYAEYTLADSDIYVTTYGRSSTEIFDETCFSEEDCYSRAQYFVEKFKSPCDSLEQIEVDYVGMEDDLTLGYLVSFELPEGTLDLRISKVTWIWDGDLFAKIDTDNEGFQPSLCISGEQVTNGGFETGDFTGWINSNWSIHVRAVGCDDPYGNVGCPHTGDYSAISYSSLGVLHQDFVTPIPVRCIQSFGFWIQAKGGDEGKPFTVTLAYTQGSPTIINLTADAIWAYIDLLGSCEAGKSVVSIEITYQNSSYVCNLDDVSLIGTG